MAALPSCAGRLRLSRWTRRKARRIDSLEFQITELERAGLKAGEEEVLTERRNLLRNAGKLIEAVEGHLALSGDEEREGPPA